MSEEPLGKMSVSAGEGGVCSVTGVTKSEPAQLSRHRGLATALYQPGRDVNHARSSVQHEAAVSRAACACLCKSNIRLTSFFAFLRGLGLLGKARVQPSGGLTVVTEIQRGTRASGTVKDPPSS